MVSPGAASLRPTARCGGGSCLPSKDWQAEEPDRCTVICAGTDVGCTRRRWAEGRRGRGRGGPAGGGLTPGKGWARTGWADSRGPPRRRGPRRACPRQRGMPERQGQLHGRPGARAGGPGSNAGADHGSPAGHGQPHTRHLWPAAFQTMLKSTTFNRLDFTNK